METACSSASLLDVPSEASICSCSRAAAQPNEASVGAGRTDVSWDNADSGDCHTVGRTGETAWWLSFTMVS